MNDEVSCRNILSHLWQTCKSRLEEDIKIFKMMEEKISEKGKNKKLRESELNVQLLMKAKEIKEMKSKIKSLCDF